MQTLEWLFKYQFAQNALITGVVVATVCSLLSVVVVLKRMAFIGQGISHAGFGGVGLAIFLNLSPIGQNVSVLLCCLATAMLIGLLGRKRRIEPDSAIGILLVASMSMGVFMDNLSAMLADWAPYARFIGARGPRPSYESLLFGSLWANDRVHMWIALVLGALVLLVALLMFKEIIFFAFDESVGRVFGLRTTLVHYTLLTLLSVTIVMGIRLAGFVLVSALLVVPGATALMLSRRLGTVFLLAWCVGVLGTTGGLVLCLEQPELSSGPCIVGVLSLIFAIVFAGTSLRRRLRGA